jgi:hypothetical protein
MKKIAEKLELFFGNQTLGLRFFEKITLVLTLILGIYIAILSFVTRPVADDFAFNAIVREHGFFDSVRVWYLTFQGRFTQQFVTGIFAYYFQSFKYLFFVYNIFLTFVFGEVLTLLLGQFLREAGGEMSKKHRRLAAYFFFFSFLFFNGQSNVYFWLTCNQIYFLSLAAMLTGFVCLLSEKITMKTRAGAVLSFGYVAGANEAFTAVCFLLLLAFFAYGIWQKNAVSKEKTLAMVIFSLQIIGLIILLGAPGNAFRQQNLPVPASLTEGIKVSINLLPFLWDVIKLKVLYGILFAFIFIPMGAQVKFARPKIAENLLLAAILAFIPVAFLSFWGILLVMSIGTGTTQALRAYTVSFFFVYTNLFLIFFLIGAVSDFGKKWGVWTGLKWAVLCLLFFSGKLFSHAPKAMLYAKEYDARFEKIHQAKREKFTGTLELEPFTHLPDYIHALEISADTSYKYNTQLKSELQLDFNLKLKENK